MVSYIGSFGSLDFGPGGDVAVVALEGWFGRPRRRDTDLLLTGHGSARGADVREARIVSMVLGLRCFDPDELVALIDTVTAYLPLGYTDELAIDDRLAWAQVEDMEVPTDPSWPGPERFLEVPVTFVCPDPRIYEAGTATSTTLSGSNPTVPNAGGAASPLAFSVAGACVAPRVRAVWHDDTPAWRFDDLTLTSGQTLTVDARTRTAVVTETGQDPVVVDHLAVDDDGNTPLWSWLHIPAGGGAYGFARTSGATTATATSRGAFL